MRDSWGARTSSPAATAVTAPGSGRRRSIRTWSGRSSPRWPKARASRHVNSGADARPFRSPWLDAVTYGAETRIGVFPIFRARDADELQKGAAAEAQPLHHRQGGAGGGVPGTGKDLVPLLTPHPQGLGRGDADLLEVRDRREDVARERVAFGVLGRCAGRNGDEDVGFQGGCRRPRRIRRCIAEHDRTPRDDACDPKAGKLADL